MAVLGVGLMLQCHEHNNGESVVLRQPISQIVEAEHARTAAATAVTESRASARAAEDAASAAVAGAGPARARARVVSDDAVIVSSPNAEPAVVRVPALVVERMRLDSSAVATLGVLVQKKESVIVAQDRRIAADSLELIATSNAFKALRRVSHPRCGRRCGIVLGVGGMLAAAVAIDQVRRTFR